MESLIQPRAFDLVFIGGGTAALAGAMEAIDLGVQRVAIVEKRSELGGECALNACVPTNTLLAAAKLMKSVHQQAPLYGITFNQVNFDFHKLMDKVNAIIHEGDQPFEDDMRVTVLHGKAEFLSRVELRVGEDVIRGDKIIIATGAEPIVPEIDGLHETGFILFDQATHLEQVPESLIIIGGGRVGVQFAQLFQWFGCPVQILEREARLMPKQEPEISFGLEEALLKDGIAVCKGCDIQRVERTETGKKRVVYEQMGEVKTAEAAEIMVSIGRSPRLNELNLAAAGVAVESGALVLNDRLKTTCDSIWAVGDVVGPHRYTHIADYQAVLAVRNAMANEQNTISYRGIPCGIVTEPAVSWVGMTERQAQQVTDWPVVLKTSASKPTRFKVESQKTGFVKIVVDGHTDQILGCHILSSESDEIIHIPALAIQQDISVQEMLKLVFAYPTRAQLIQKALETYPREKEKAHAHRQDNAREAEEAETGIHPTG
jgi:pyruvate/2-oxoglutarate dehydrogenase complex dihydrolipoamide dehydrogenase (E3) component